MGEQINLLNSLYKKRLKELRDFAENNEISKSGSVEVLRSRLIKLMILDKYDLSWEGIQSIPHKKMGEILKVFGIKSSGSHKERRQRLWLHTNFDSRRMSIERLAEMDRETLYELCQRLEMPLTGTRTVLMGRVGGVLTNQLNAWGKIKRSLHRNGIQMGNTIIINSDKNTLANGKENLKLDKFDEVIPVASYEDAKDLIIINIDKEDEKVQGDLLFLQSRISELDRMIGTILREYGGKWGQTEMELLIRLVKRRGWPVDGAILEDRFVKVARDIAEIKGAIFDDGTIERPKLDANIKETIERIRSSISDLN